VAFLASFASLEAPPQGVPGLGLWTVARLVQRLGGQIDIEKGHAQVEGGGALVRIGTHFIVMLPLPLGRGADNEQEAAALYAIA
jgi:signal transduction histidine kinase